MDFYESRNSDDHFWESRDRQSSRSSKNFPSDFQYILGLQEASVVGMADGFAQSIKKPVLVSLHTSAGTGNGMGNIMTAFLNKTPLIITAGQQTREMLVGDPMLANRDETMLPRPWVKWSYQPVRAQDVPAAIMRAYAVALQPPWRVRCTYRFRWMIGSNPPSGKPAFDR